MHKKRDEIRRATYIHTEKRSKRKEIKEWTFSSRYHDGTEVMLKNKKASKQDMVGKRIIFLFTEN